VVSPLIGRHMRQFPLLRPPWRRYETTYDPVAKAFEKRQYRKAESAYRLMGRILPSSLKVSVLGSGLSSPGSRNVTCQTSRRTNCIKTLWFALV
jgi:hypothetical protein